MKEIDYVANILLIDDSPLKNLLNNGYNDIHPSTSFGDETNNFLDACLWLWLNGLLMSKEAVPIYIRANLLCCYQMLEVNLSPVAFHILKELCRFSSFVWEISFGDL